MMTQVLMSAGSVARIFTTVQERGSTSMIGAYVVRGKGKTASVRSPSFQYYRMKKQKSNVAPLWSCAETLTR